MRLVLYASTPRAVEPSYVSVQDPRLVRLPTVLVCPMRQRLEWKVFRVKVEWAETTYIVAPDLARKVTRDILRPFGELDPESSCRVMEAFLSLLAHES